MSGKHPQSYLIAGFVLVVLLMLGLGGLGAQRLETLKGRTDHILQEQVVKVDLAHRLRSIIRERMIRMNLMIITSDPFVRNQSYHEYLALGSHFTSAQQKLEKLVTSRAEQAMLAQLRSLSLTAAPIQQRVVDLALDGNLELARSLLFGQTLLLQQQMLDFCDSMLDTFEQANQAEMEQVKQNYLATYTLMMSLTALAVLLTAIIGIIVIRLIKADRELLMSEIAERRRTEYQLRQVKDGLEHTIAERTATLRENAERLAEAQRISRMGHWDWNILSNEFRWSDEIYRLFGLQANALGATFEAFMEVVNPEDRELVSKAVESALRKESGFHVEHRITRPDGAVLYIRQKGEVSFDDSGQPIRMIGTMRDITAERKNEKYLWHLAHHDSMTGLPNRSQLYASLSRALARAKRSGGKVALMLCDLDHFKEINDRYGHDAGDQVIVEAAERIKFCVRASDLVARLAGDEFTVVMEEVRDPEDTLQVAQKITAALSAPFELSGGHQGMIGISIGIALYPDDAMTMNELLKYADVAMYRVKERGRGNYCLYADQYGQNRQDDQER